MFKLIVRVVLSRPDPVAVSFRLAPFFIGLAVFVIVMSFVFKTPMGKQLDLGTPVVLLLSLVLACVLGFAGKKALLIFKNVRTGEEGAEGVFRRIQIGTSCYVALAQGANDVANAIGPLALIYFLVKTGEAGTQVPVPFVLLLFGGVGIAVGIAMGGARVIETVGERITTLSNTRGFAVDFAAATTVLMASKMGLPVSTTHAAVGGVMGVGLARGLEAVNFGVIFRIMLYWVLTVPMAAATSMVIFKIIDIIM
ncbi:MAG: inorganic phosphate transporter, partial [Thermodesulfobacteriota bacterium]